MISSLLLSLVMCGAADSTDCAPPSSWIRVSEKTTDKTNCECQCDCTQCGKSKKDSAIPSTDVGTPKKIVPAKETIVIHRLADKFGQVWTHSDKAYLESFIQQRNTIAPVQYFYGVGSSCATGNCPARR